MTISFKPVFSKIFMSTLAIASLLSSAIFHAHADTAKVRLHGQVALNCDVQLLGSVSKIAPGQYNLGTLRQRCNAPQGYRVLAFTASGLQDAEFYLSGIAVPVNPSGETILFEARSHLMLSQSLMIKLADTASDANDIGDISIRIETL